MNSNGGRAAGSGKREFYTAVALLAMVFLIAGALFAVPAWSQDGSGDLAGNTVREEDTAENNGVGDGFIDLVRILNAQDCDVDPGATIVFEDENDNLFLVADGINAQIFERNDEIRVRDDEDPGTENGTDAEDENIEFLDEDGEFVELEDDTSLRVVSSSGIECRNNNNGNNNNNSDNNRADRFRERLNDVLRDDGLVVDEEGNILQEEEDLLDAEEDLLNDEVSTLEDEDNLLDDEISTLEDEDGLGDDGVSASSDEDGAEASTPGASASARDPDEQAPERSTRGDVVDDVVTSGPLPNTGGAPVAAGTVLAMVLFGGGLLVVRLVMIWRGRRA